jgi:hypothetical protein
MATKTLGTATTSSLVAVAWSQDPSVLLPADLATIAQHILDDQTTGHPVAQVSGVGGLVREGKLFVPNRGSLTIYPGDYIAYDPTTGGVILVTALAAAGASWVHS